MTTEEEIFNTLQRMYFLYGPGITRESNGYSHTLPQSERGREITFEYNPMEIDLCWHHVMEGKPPCSFCMYLMKTYVECAERYSLGWFHDKVEDGEVGYELELIL